MRQVAIVLLTALLLQFPRAAAAAPTPEEKVRAREHYQKGLTHYDIKEYSEALAEFKNAYREVQDPAFLFNIAQCYRKLGQDVEALDYYRNYARRFPTAPNRAEVDRRIQEIERELEGKPRPATPPPIEPKPDPRATGGAITPITPPPNGAAPALTQPQPGPAATVVTTAEPAGDRGEAPIYKRWWFWTGVGAVVVGAVVAGIAIATRGEVGDCQGIDPCRTVGD